MVAQEWLTVDSVEFQTIQKIVRSAEGIAAAVLAAKQGRPALCGVDSLLREEFEKLGISYKAVYSGTLNAGSELSALMQERGYTKAGRGRCPSGCVAQSGILWKPPSAT
jgi:hypothetical protein